MAAVSMMSEDAIFLAFLSFMSDMLESLHIPTHHLLCAPELA